MKWFQLHEPDERRCVECRLKFTGTFLQAYQLWKGHRAKVHRFKADGVEKPPKYKCVDHTRDPKLWLREKEPGEKFGWACHLCNIGLAECDVTDERARRIAK